jgi:DNA/RNA-binding domain of Phe-tRNA-synthetase-like protein
MVVTWWPAGRPGMMNVHVQFHHLVDIEGARAARDRHAHGVAHEISNVMVFSEGRVLREQRTLLRLLDIRFDPANPSLRALLKRVNIILSESR